MTPAHINMQAFFLEATVNTLSSVFKGLPLVWGATRRSSALIVYTGCVGGILQWATRVPGNGYVLPPPPNALAFLAFSKHKLADETGRSADWNSNLQSDKKTCILFTSIDQRWLKTQPLHTNDRRQAPICSSREENHRRKPVSAPKFFRKFLLNSISHLGINGRVHALRECAFILWGWAGKHALICWRDQGRHMRRNR